MASTLTLYNKLTKYLQDGTIDLDTNTIKLALVTSSYTPDAAHDVLADVLGSPSCEVEAIASPNNGYTAGGEELASKTLTQTDSPAETVFDAADLTFAALTATFRYGILYASGTLNGIVNPLIGYILFDTTPADIVMSGIDFVVQWNASGITKIAKA